MGDKERETVITVRMNREERQMLQALADADGISVSDVVRMGVRRAYGERKATLRRVARTA